MGAGRKGYFMKKIVLPALLCVLLSILLLPGCKAGQAFPVPSAGAEATPADQSGIVMLSDQEYAELDADGNVVKYYRYDAYGKLSYVHETVWEKGRIVKKTSYDGSGNLTASFPYTYDERGNMTTGTWFVYNRGELMLAEYVYDEQDRQIEVTRWGTDSVATNKTFITYNEAGLEFCREYHETWPDSAPVFTYNEYDVTGRVVKTWAEDENREMLWYELYTWTGFGKIDEYTNYDPEGNPNYTYKYYYDENGARTKTERYDGEGNLESTSY